MIANKYQLLSKIGEGKFGKVYKGLDQKTGEQVAIKIESIVFDENTQSIAKLVKMLKRETMILNYLHGHHCRNIPLVYWYGMHQDLPTLVMPFYDLSLQGYIESLWLDRSSLIEISIILKIMISIVDILENLHSHFVIHRDIKPDNFMVSWTNPQKIKLTLIDFGLATVFVDDRKQHFPMKVERSSHIIGTPKYISTHIHEGIEPCRRDDLISVGYIGLQMLVGGLPWPRNEAKGVENTVVYERSHILHPLNQEYKNAKQEFLDNIIASSLQSVEDDNNEMIILQFIKSVYHLDFTETPNYIDLCRIMSTNE